MAAPNNDSMTDDQAIEFANTIGQYARESLREGMTLTDVEQLTVRELLNDLVESLPRNMESKLDDTVVEMIGGLE